MAFLTHIFWSRLSVPCVCHDPILRELQERSECKSDASHELRCLMPVEAGSETDIACV